MTFKKCANNTDRASSCISLVMTEHATSVRIRNEEEGKVDNIKVWITGTLSMIMNLYISFVKDCNTILAGLH